MSIPESKGWTAGATATGAAVSGNAYDAVTEQQATTSSHPSATNQSGAGGGGATSEAAKQVAAQLAELLRNDPDALRDVLAQVGQTAGPAAAQAEQHPLSRFDKQKENFVNGLGSLTEEIRQMNRNLRRSEHSGIVPLAAQYGDAGADRIEQLSKFLSGKNVTEHVVDAARFAQRNAAYLVPGAFLLGLVGARFLKSSTPTAAQTAGSDNGGTDVALPPPPPVDIIGATASDAPHDRTPQPAQEVVYTSRKQDAEVEKRAFAVGADRGTLERENPLDFMGDRTRSS